MTLPSDRLMDAIVDWLRSSDITEPDYAEDIINDAADMALQWVRGNLADLRRPENHASLTVSERNGKL